MSTQSPTPPTPKGQRNNNRRNQKRVTTPHTQKASLVTTPPSSPPRNMSPGSLPVDSTTNNNTNINNLGLSKKKGARSKKVREDQNVSTGYTNGHRHTSSNPNVGTPLQMRDSPHYAGPTFHASPAPSALPMPSFFSKSVPDSELATMLETDSDGADLDTDADLDMTPSKSKSPSRPSQRDEERKPTPLDFLFKAAVEARNTQRHSSSDNEARRSPISARADPTSPSARRADSVAGGLFPLEMDTPGRTGPSIGPSFATPYKDRMNALRSANSPSPVVEPSNEAERRAKTAALKDLLLNPRPQRPSSTSPFASSPFGKPNSAGPPLRTSSGPATPVSYGSPHGQGRSPFESEKQQRQQQQSYFAPAQANRSPPPHPHPYGHGHGPQRDMNPLHSAVSSETPRRPIPGAPYPPHSTSRSGMQPYAESPLRQHSPYSHSVPTNVSTPASSTSSKPVDTKQMEDDLRRILKLGATAGLKTNGVQSSFA